MSSAFPLGGLFFALILIAPARAAPPGSASPPDLLQVGVPDQAEGRAVIEQFRQAGPPRPYYLEFDLDRLPRRGPEEFNHGQLWADRNQEGTVLRIEVNPGTEGERRFLVQNGANPSVWESDRHGGVLSQPGKVGPFTPLVPGLPVVPFDLQMPYLYWPDARLLSVSRVRGRPAHVFVFRPPAGVSLPPPIAAVRAYLDTQYHAPVETELITDGGRVIKTFSLLDLKKIGEEWLPKDIDLRDEASRDKGRFSVTAAAMNLDLLPAIFLPAALSEPVAPPPPGEMVRLQ